MAGKLSQQTYMIKGGNDLKLFVKEIGNPNGKPLFFIHGYSLSHLVWTKQFHSKLAEQFRLIAMDIRGHGFSEKPFQQYFDSKLWADDVQSVIHELQLNHPVLIGWSYGGRVILDYIRVYGDSKIGGINFIGIGAQQNKKFELDDETWMKPYLTGRFSHHVVESAEAMEMFVKMCVRQNLSDEELFFFLGITMYVPPYVRKQLLERPFDYNDELEKIRKPVLITHGMKDCIVGLDAAKYNAMKIKHAITSSYEEIGHSPFWEQPERFNRELTEFVNSL